MGKLETIETGDNFLKSAWEYFKGDPKKASQVVDVFRSVIKKRGLHNPNRVNWQGAFDDLVSNHKAAFGFPEIADMMPHINANLIQNSYNTITGQDIDGWWRCATCHGKGGWVQKSVSKKTGQEFVGVLDCVKCHTTGYANPSECGCDQCAGATNEFVRNDNRKFEEALESIRDTDPSTYKFILAIRQQKTTKRRQRI